MCGLTGLWTFGEEREEELAATVLGMAEVLHHRGPDDGGTFVDARAGLALGHRRLSILDLSEQGHQPMLSQDGRHVLVYNGEVYGFRELRAELEREGARFRGGSDTEVLLAALTRWGVERALGRLVGMFAFALWDREERSLVLARDRLGIKPLYWGLAGGRLLFGSELKALRACPSFEPELDRDALALYFRHNYVPAPHTIYRGVSKLRPGTWARITADGAVEERSYWSAREVARAGARDPLTADVGEVDDRLDALLADAVRLRRVADVPLGAFLSGGIDSSLVVALMQEAGGEPVRTFTIGFAEAAYDEAGHARAVARHLGTDHTELVLSPDEVLATVPELSEHWDEPFSDSSQIPTLLVSRLARRSVTVSLSGDGGDELFGGYHRYRAAARIRRAVQRVPPVGRRVVSLALRTGAASLERVPLPAGRAPRRMRTASELLGAPGESALYRELVSHWRRPEALVRGATEPVGEAFQPELAAEEPAFDRRMMLIDTLTYLPDDILTKVDRASMATGLEARVPLLDHRLVELAWRLPTDVRVGPDPGKAPLRRLLARRLPPELFERPKMGFGVPLAAWLRGPLRDWGEALLCERRLEAEGVLEPRLVRRRWREHVSGRADWGYHLWDVLVFQAWRERWLS
jgi:asparagine synthase (glutamine-hydrolysing)